MKRFSDYIPLHFSFFLIVGILIGYRYHFPLWNGLGSLMGLLLVLWGLYIWNKKHYRLHRLFQILSYLLVVLVGVVAVRQQISSGATHYTHYQKKPNTHVFQITKRLKENTHYYRYYADVMQVDSSVASGRILVNLQKDSLCSALDVGGIYLTKGLLTRVAKPLNPYTFDYQKYLEKKKILHQLVVGRSAILRLPLSLFSPQVYAGVWREKIENSLKRYSFGQNEMAIIEAFVLGQRQAISKELLNNYTAAGIIHILAVSGLHVGILFLLLSFVLSPITKLKNGSYLKSIIILLFLWGFALLTGLSASVVRAVTMFTFIAIGMAVKNQRSPVLHALFASFLVLLLIQPLYLFDIGFQMSYAAVFGIVLGQPKIVGLLPDIKCYLLRKIWLLASVSIAATLATLPLSLYYFHQFPGLFLLANIVVMLFVGLLMSIGIVVVVLAVFQILPDIVVQIYSYALQMMNTFIAWVAAQEAFLFKNVSFSIAMLIMSYLFIIMGYRLWEKSKINRLYAFLTVVILCQLLFVFEKHQTATVTEFVVFNKSKESIIGVTKGDDMLILHSLDSLRCSNLKFISDYKTYKNIKNSSCYTVIPNLITYKNTPILIVDSLGIYQHLQLKSPIVLLRQSPKINIERLLRELHPKVLLVDASNYKTYVAYWRSYCLKNNVAFHYTGNDAAYVLK